MSQTHDEDEVSHALRASEERFRRLSEAASEGIVVHDGEFVLFANRAASVLTGYPEAELVGMRMSSLVPPEGWPAIVAHIRSGSEEPMVGTILKKGGPAVAHEVRAANIEWAGRPARVIAFRDISRDLAQQSELQHEIEARRAAERNFRTLIEDSPDGIMVHREGRIVYVNRQMCQMLACRDPAGLLGKPVLEVVHPDVRPAIAARIQQVVSSGRPSPPRDVRLLRQDGGVFVAEMTGVVIEFDGAPAVVAVARDVAERRRSETLREGEGRALQLIAADAPLVQVLDELCRLLEALAPGIRCWFEIAEVETQTQAALAAAAEHAKPVSTLILAADGSTLGNFICARAGDELLDVRTGELVRRVVHLAGIAIARRRAESQLLVSDRLASVGTLAAGVAHEINNPLAVVATALEWAARHLALAAPDDPLAQKLSEPLRDAREAAERVRLIVRDLKVFSRPDVERHERLDVREVLETTLRMAGNEIRHRARVVRQYGEVPHVSANEARLGQVLLNLVVNAAQAIPEGMAEANEIRVVTRTDASGRAVIEIIDSGVGMSPETLRRAFNPFFTTKPVGQGTGLGLAICRGIVATLGGEIQVESDLGRGSCFRVVLPSAGVAAAAPAPVLAHPEAPAGQVAPGTVLVVDDEPQVGSAIARVLAPPHQVTRTTDAREALALLRSGRRFDAVLCDLMMPHVTGMDLYQEVMAFAPEQAQRMVFMTGGAFTTRARRFLEDVRIRSLEKPFQAEALLEVVEGVMLSHRGARQ
jgi:two-component system NtrC family sensor kinase